LGKRGTIVERKQGIDAETLTVEEIIRAALKKMVQL